jgi:GT2 family glycosyltransferase
MRRDWIQKCLDSLLASSVKTEIIVIDNGSADETVNFIRKNYPQVDLIEANENLGFAKANNLGIKKAYEQGADYVFLLNQDAWTEKDTIEKLVEAFEKLPEAGIVSPVHLNGSKTDLDYSFIDLISRTSVFNYLSDFYFSRVQEFYETHFVNAAAWLISRKCIETVGGFDTLLFYHYGEDDNYCQRVIYHKFKIYIATTTTICHDRGERTGHHSAEHIGRISEVSRCVRYANITKSDDILNDIRIRLSLQYAIRKILRFQIKRLGKERITDKQLYENLKKSRSQNKKIGLNWL